MSYIKTNHTIACNCRYHVVFYPKYRRKVLINGVDERLKTILLETIEKWGQEFIEMEVMPDHAICWSNVTPNFGFIAW